MENPGLDPFFDPSRRWGAEMQALRAVVLRHPLREERKWGQPVYTHQGGNLAIVSRFKDCFILGFFKGALLADPEALLSRPGENTQGSRTLRMTSLAEVEQRTNLIAGFVQAAIALEEAGAKVDYSVNKSLVLPAELIAAFARFEGLQAAFRALTPGRQRACNLHFTGAKQLATRAARIEKCRDDILAGKGFGGR